MKIKFYILLILFSTSIFSQNPVETKIDKKINKIGAQFNLTLKTTVDTLSTVVFPNTKTFGKLEVIRNYVIDTVRKDAKYELIKRYGLTQFDSGRYVIPKMTVLINKKPFLSDSISVDVKDVLVDTLKQKMYDIKPISQVENSGRNWWKYILGILLLAGIGFLVYYLLKKYQKKKAEELVFKTPIEKAIGMLKILETKQLWQKGEIKNYYSELTDIARDYIEEVIEIPAKESTTSELIAGLRKAVNAKKLTFTKQSFSNLENVLKQADLVKFAKVEPSQNQIEEDYKRIEKSIISLHQSIPTEEVEDENDLIDSELQRQKILKKQKRKRIITSIAVLVGLLSAFTTYKIVTKGFDFVKDTVTGHPTKELLESKWINSYYGNPNVYVSTPKVLKRMDISKTMPKEALATLKEIEMFGYGSMLDNFYIALITGKPKQEIKMDYAKVIEGNVNYWKTTGIQNIVIKQEEFISNDGITGSRAFGTMTIVDKVQNKNFQLSFEMLLFNEDGGLQQIILVRRSDDNYGLKIIDSIKNSVELKTANK
jgi:hypothetical protein